MTLRILATKPLVHLASISLAVSLAVVGVSSFQTTVQAKPAPTNQRVSSPRRALPLPGNLGSPRGRTSGATRGGGNNEEAAAPTVPNTATVSSAPTDPTAQVLAKWGWTRIGCSPGAVFITGMGADTVCVNPTSGVAGGSYTYNQATNQLIPLNSPPENRQSPPQNTEAPSRRIF